MSNLTLLLCVICLVASCCASCKKDIREKELKESEKFAIVDAHNKFRLAVARGQVRGQPKGINLKRLKWDSRLAKSAQKAANTCKFKHVAVKNSRRGVGQNLYMRSLSAYSNKRLNVTAAVESWFNEYKSYKYPKFTSATGHYTQVVWANTKRIGCGYTHFKTPKSKSKFKYHKLLVCNYSPSGNVKGQAPYKVGTKGCRNLC